LEVAAQRAIGRLRSVRRRYVETWFLAFQFAPRRLFEDSAKWMAGTGLVVRGHPEDRRARHGAGIKSPETEESAMGDGRGTLRFKVGRKLSIFQ